MSDLEKRVAETLAAHTSNVVYYIDGGGDEGHIACHGCEWKAPSFTGFHEHVAAALAPLIAEAWDAGYTVGNAHNGRRDANSYRSNDE